MRDLDPYTRKAFEGHLSSSEIPEYKTLIDFVTQQLKAQEYCEQNASKPASKVASFRQINSNKSKNQNVFITNSTPPSHNQKSNVPGKFRNFRCPKCNKSHPLFVFPSYTAMSRKDKFGFLKTLKRCFNCFGLHNIKDCGSKNSCKVCKSNRHHTSLHPDDDKCDDKVVSNKLVHIN